MLDSRIAFQVAAAEAADGFVRRLARGDCPAETGARVGDGLRAMAESLAPRRLRVRAGDVLFRAGERCMTLSVLTAGIVEVRREAQTRRVAYRFRGDWLGLEGACAGRHDMTAVAIDNGEVWQLRLGALFVAGALQPALIAALCSALQGEAQTAPSWYVDRAGTPCEHRMAVFLHEWAAAMIRQGRTDGRIGLRPSRGDLAAALDVPAEAARRAMAALVAADALRWADEVRCDEVVVDGVAGLRRVIERGSPQPALH